MRPGSLAVVAVVCALLGASTALIVAKSAGWVGAGGATRTVVLTTSGGTLAANESIDENAEAKPLPGNDFDPARIYRERAAGVVTIYALFGPNDSIAAADAAQGSGFVASADGYILTNSHVITTAGEGDPTAAPEAASTVFVEFKDGDRVKARVVGWDIYDDVGLLKVRPADHHLTVVPLGDSAHVVVGQPVAAIGSPFGNESSLSVGVVSATRSIPSLTSSYNLVGAIQTDAPINRGNSGGPMFDARGRVIGINAQINSDSGNAEGVGFAVPINSARRSMEQLIESGEARYAWLGVSTQTLTPRLAEHFDYPVHEGAAVQTVVADSPASEAGIQGGGAEKDFTGISFRPGGDLIVAIDGVPVETADDVVRAITEGLLPGQTTRLSIIRDGRRIEITVKLGERPATPPGPDR